MDRVSDAGVGRLDARDVADVFRALPTPYVVLTLGLRVVAVNPAFEAATVQSADDLVGRGLFDAFPATGALLDDHGRSPTEALLRQVAATGQPASTPAYRHDLPGPDGCWLERHWLSTAAPVLDGEGRVRLLVNRPEDVSDFVAMREQGRAAEHLGERWRIRSEQIEADLFAQTQALTVALAEREAAARQATALAEVALALASTQTLEDIEAQVFASVVALNADGGSLITAAPDGTWRLANSEALGGWVNAVHRLLPHDSPLPGIATARSGMRLLLPTRQSGLDVSPLMEQVYEDTQRSAWVFLPLRAGGRSLGALAVAWDEEREFTDFEIDLLDGVAAQCAQAVLRVAATTRERDEVRAVRRLAEELQHALLTPPPEPDHLHVVVRYQAATFAAEVGGDWYDAFQQPDGATMLVIGDVVGHDASAAARMGQLRGVLRALAYDADSTSHDTCAAILRRTEHTTHGLDVGALATAVLARIERNFDQPTSGSRLLRWCNAGHPPPLLLAPDGSSRLLETGGSDLMLGVDVTTDRTEGTVELPDGHTLLLYTDGLIERRGTSLDDGLDELQQALADLGQVPLDELCDTLLSRLEGDTEDDVALVAVRGYPEDRHPPKAAPNRTRRSSRTPDTTPPEPMRH